MKPNLTDVGPQVLVSELRRSISIAARRQGYSLYSRLGPGELDVGSFPHIDLVMRIRLQRDVEKTLGYKLCDDLVRRLWLMASMDIAPKTGT